MGGIGSGSWCRWDKKTTVEDCRVLDLNRMRKCGAIFAQGVTNGSWVWSDPDTDEERSSIGYESNTLEHDNSYLRIDYTFTESQKKIDYKVRLERTRTNYGERFWFVCPVTGKRVTKLYLPSGGDIFASRHAYRLPYASQSENAAERALRKKWKLVRKTDGDMYPVRPKGMHHKTYERLMDKFCQVEEECDAHLAGMLMKLGYRL